jgi:hypothetical protein
MGEFTCWALQERNYTKSVLNLKLNIARLLCIKKYQMLYIQILEEMEASGITGRKAGDSR